MNKSRFCLLALTMLSVLLLAGCANQVQPTRKAVDDSNLVQSSHAAVDALLGNVRGVLDPAKPILTASFVSIDRLTESSSLGRMMAEQATTRLTRHGYTVIEMKLRDSIFIRDGMGEFMLSRELQHLSLQHDAQAVVVGTYAVGSNTIYVTARIVRASDGVILSSHDYQLPLGPNTRHLLRSQRR